LQFIGDRRIKTLDDARDYIVNKLQKSFRELGFGMLIVKLKDGGISIGTCGLLKRDYLEDVDLGFAFLPGFRGKGYAFETASATINYGKENLGMKRILAFADADNSASIKSITKLGLEFERLIDFPDDDAEIKLYGANI